MDGPLAGIRVLDVTQGMPGAIVTMLLCDYGCEVVKVEPPRPVSFANPARATWDRGKRSIVLDLAVADTADTADREVLRRLVAGADVVLVDPALPDEAAVAAGLDADGVAAANPGAVHARLTALGPYEEADPMAARDIIAAARLGVFAESPGHRDGPIYPGHPGITYGTAFVALLSILASLRRRVRTGAGDRLEVGFEDGVLGVMTMNWSCERAPSFIAYKGRTGTLDLGHRRLLLRRFACADGMVQVHTGAVGAFGRAMTAFGLAGEISPAEGPAEMATELTDADLALLAERLPPFFHARTVDGVCELLWKHEVACLPVQPPGAAFTDPQVRHAGIIDTVDDPELGRIRIVGPVIRFAGTPGAVRGAAPARDADGAALRRDGWSAPGLGHPELPSPVPPALSGPGPQAGGPPLSGLRVVEFGSWFASPYGNRLLADLGADVIKVETLAGDPQRALPDPYEGGNHGKRAVCVNLKDPRARPVLDALLASADVVQHNMRPGAAERLGLDYDSARALRPDIVYGYSPGFGSTGPKAQLQSFAPLVGGMVGLMHLFAGEGNEPHTGFGNEDYYNGLLSAASILMALIHRERGGPGQFVELPQLHSSILVTSEWFVGEGRARSLLPVLNHEQTGAGPFHRVYQCLDGWLLVVCDTADERAACVGAVAAGDPERLADLRAALADGHAGAARVEEALAYLLTGDLAENWEGRLRAAGVPCAVAGEASWLQPFLHDDKMIAEGRVAEIEHPRFGPARIIGQVFRRPDVPAPSGRGPNLGEHTAEILTELGFGPRVAELLAAGVLGEPG
ncbi:putative Alpha-methylacyl-CoA racemase [Frankia canadensis]|uniref:Putative Alpha-methylacyl-CoA racemase n=1 Tax=Frankia canadensis TaxID=1836972 RepID=A0A2I2KR60_9ACTN|nr:CoA transferase [Frankia canadensis]SNQ48139.1 putative Alpha-methylacyl-CoA racemase [Frankia canadensis]SOU55429.1 putative Alpha-methylacyl-CoA racemase [Frankia canadensis]